MVEILEEQWWEKVGRSNTARQARSQLGQIDQLRRDGIARDCVRYESCFIF